VSVVDETRAGASETAVYVDHAERDAHTQGHLWSARAGDGCSFVAAASGSFDAVQDSGNFQFTDTPGPQSTGQTIDTVRPGGRGSGENVCALGDCGSVELSGRLLDASGASIAAYTFELVHAPLTAAARTRTAPQSPPTDTDTLSFHVTVTPIDPVLQVRASGSRVILTWDALSPAEDFFGLGEQYTVHGLRGRTVPVATTEQGVGRGLQPLTRILDIKGPYHNSAGNWHTTYTAIPHYLSSELRSVFVNDSRYMTFDFADDHSLDSVCVTVMVGTGASYDSSSPVSPVATEAAGSDAVAPWHVTGYVYHGVTPAAIIQQHTAITGRMIALPEWVQAGGLVAGWEGGTAKVRDFWALLKTANVSLAGFWLQDWTGLRDDVFGKRLWWNWELDEDWYPGWGDLVRDLRNSSTAPADGPRMLTYMNPYLANTVTRDKPNNRRDLWAEAAKAGFLIKNATGDPYVQHSASKTFSFSAIDLTSEAARAWTKRVIRCNMLGDQAGCDGNATAVDGAMSGFMSDFGEYTPFDAVLSGGISGADAHNAYPALWSQTCREAIREAGLEGDVVFFSRSASARSPGQSTLFWAGDQLTTWDAFDGMQSAVRAMLSGGLSGMSLTHSDTGGYTEFRERVYNIVRTEELLLRWVEFEAFSGAMLRTHPGLLPDSSAQVTSDAKSLAHFGFYSHVHKALGPYRKATMYEATFRGTPMMRYMFMEFPADTQSWNLTSQFMFGSEFLVAPVLGKGEKTNNNVYLPPGTKWAHVWSGEQFTCATSRKQADSATTKGCTVSVPAPLGEVPAFVRVRNATDPASDPALAVAAGEVIPVLQLLWAEWSPKMRR
jgi:alpha-glucosidase